MQCEAQSLRPRPGTVDRTLLATADDRTLVALLLAEDESAWREFVRRYDTELRGMARKRLSASMESLLPSDAVEDVIGDLYLKLVEDRMACLRRWAAYAVNIAVEKRHDFLRRWLALIVCGIAVDHIRAAWTRRSASFGGDEDAQDGAESEEASVARDHCSERKIAPGRGAAWTAMEQAAGEKRRHRRRRSKEEIEDAQRAAQLPSAKAAPPPQREAATNGGRKTPRKKGKRRTGGTREGERIATSAR